MKQPETKKYDDAYKLFKKAFSDFIKKLKEKLNKLTIKSVIFSGSNPIINLEDNTVYAHDGSSGGVKKLTIKYPTSDFIATILFSTAKSGDITINFPEDSLFTGHRTLEFFNGEHWEINIHNKRVIATQIFEE